MKRKFLFTLLALVLCFTTFTYVHAADAKTITTPAKAIVLEPDETDSIYAVMDDNGFDEFSNFVEFSANGSNSTITPKAQLYKIIITTNPALEDVKMDYSKKATEVAGAADYWFTAYCLDGSLKFPTNGIHNMPAAWLNQAFAETYDGSTKKVDYLLGATTLIALSNSPKFNTLLANQVKGKGYDAQTEIEYKLAGGTEFISFSTEYLGAGSSMPATPTADLTIAGQEYNKLNTGTSITVEVKSITFNGTDGKKLKVPAEYLVQADPDNASTDGNYNLTYDYKSILLDNYSIKKLSGENDYKHSLWIIEHSYPSMGLNDFLLTAGTDYETLVNQIKGLYGSETFTDEEVANLVDNYVYYTVQYAIWKVNGYTDGGKQLGDELRLGTLGKDNALNVVYNYLIKDRDEYKDYGTKPYTAELTVDTSNNDKVAEKGDFYVYGPYTAKYDVIDPTTFTLEVTSANKADVSIVDKDDKVLTSVKEGEEFYIKCKKSARVTSAEVKVSATGRTYDNNARGAIYYSNNALSQNVISGLKYVNVNNEATITLTYNPKTGVPNIAIIFIVTLIAFSLGYVALTYNNKAVKLD